MKRILFLTLIFSYAVSFGQTVNYNVVTRNDSTFLLRVAIKDGSKTTDETYVPNPDALFTNVSMQYDSIIMSECRVIRDLKNVRDQLSNAPTMLTILNALKQNDFTEVKSSNYTIQMSGEYMLIDTALITVDTLQLQNTLFTSIKGEVVNAVVYHYDQSNSLGKIRLDYGKNTPRTYFFYLVAYLNEQNREVWADLNSGFYLIRSR